MKKLNIILFIIVILLVSCSNDEIDNLNSEINSLEQENNELLVKVAELEAENNDMKDKVANMQKNVEIYKFNYESYRYGNSITDSRYIRNSHGDLVWTTTIGAENVIDMLSDNFCNRIHN